MGKEYEILDEREESSMASCWNVYLCLCAGDTKRFRLYNGMYAPLAESEAYYNEETEDYDLPEEIKGTKVIGLMDDWVIGGDPEWVNAEDTVEFDSPSDQAVKDWLTEHKWVKPQVLERLRSGFPMPPCD